RGVHHVGIGHEIAAPVDEPAGAGLRERHLHRGLPLATVHGDVRVDASGDEGDRRFSSEDRFLDAERERGSGDISENSASALASPCMAARTLPRSLALLLESRVSPDPKVIQVASAY